ncbi:MAG: restriction endonuclease subunit S [Chloroflexota bacterium]
MTGEWPKVAVSDVAIAVIGGTPSRSVPAYWDGDIPWATAKDIANTAVRYLNETQEFITEEGLENSAAKLLPTGTVVITARGTVGAIAQLGREMTFNQTCYALIPKEGLDNNFLFYVLKGTIAEMQALTYGTVFETITTQSFNHWIIPFPPLPEQRAIAHILGTLDDKIELNRRMSQTLEQMARALFKAWFVDFEPVRAKCRGDLDSRPRWRRGESLPGLPAHLYDLFPDRLVDSELGEIPEGWEVKPVGDLAEVVGGSTPRTERPEYWEDGIHYFATPKDLAGLATPVLLDTERKITDEGLAQISSGLLPAGTVLLSSRAPIGYLAIAEVPVAVNQGFIAMKPKQGVSSLFLLRWACSSHEEIVSHANGSTFLEISKSSFRPIPVITPDDAVMSAFDELSKPLYRKVVQAECESRTLAALRDALLPKLISGQMRIRDAERFLKERGL